MHTRSSDFVHQLSTAEVNTQLTLFCADSDCELLMFEARVPWFNSSSEVSWIYWLSSHVISSCLCMKSGVQEQRFLVLLARLYVFVCIGLAGVAASFSVSGLFPSNPSEPPSVSFRGPAANKLWLSQCRKKICPQ